MKALALLAIAASSSLAAEAPVLFGVDAQVGAVMPTIGSNLQQYTSHIGFDAMAAGTVGIPLTPNLALQGAAGLAFQSWSVDVSTLVQPSTESTAAGWGYVKSVDDVVQENLELSIGPKLKVNNNISLLAGYTWTVPLAGTVKSGDRSKDIEWAGSKPSDGANFASTHHLYVGGLYMLRPGLSVGANLSIGLTGILPRLNYRGSEYDGVESRNDNIVMNRLNLGLHYDFNR